MSSPTTDGKALQIAIYGKGGIGKSTVSSNISFICARNKIKVLQIGCDPKHDSTKNLLGGVDQHTVLESMDAESEKDLTLDALLMRAPCGVDCIECGGPEPGIGCAGRGIITAMNELKRLGLSKDDYDVVLYDVLGDVVCGGFAVPLRKEYADVVYLVTSGEFMAVYAANNILRGIRNHSGDKPRVGGIILNCRGMEDEKDLVSRFSRAVEVPIVCEIPRDGHFAISEREGKTISEMFPDSEPTSQFVQLVKNIEGHIDGSSELYTANPLSDYELDLLLKGKEIEERSTYNKSKSIRKSDGEACAARAAAMSLCGIKDLKIIIHGPRACGYNMCNIRDVHLLSDIKTNPKLDVTFTDNMLCTDMDDNDSIFGGIRKLEALLRTLCDGGSRYIAIVTACIPGIIGDDVTSCIEKFESEYEGLKILDVRADGNLTGSAFAGMRMVRRELLKLTDMDVRPEKGFVNILSATGMNSSHDRERVEELLSCVGLKLNTIMFNGCSVDDVINCRKAEFCLPMSRRDLLPENCGHIEAKGMRVQRDIIPCGVEDTREWLKKFETPENSGQIASYLKTKEERYQRRLESAKIVLKGKKIFLIGWLDRPLDWIADALKDAGANIIGATSIGPLSGKPFHSDRHTDVPIIDGSNGTALLESIATLEPDLVLGSFRGEGLNRFRNGPIPPGSISFDASADLLDHVCNLIRIPLKTTWRECGSL